MKLREASRLGGERGDHVGGTRASQGWGCFWDSTAIPGAKLLISCSMEAWGDWRVQLQYQINQLGVHSGLPAPISPPRNTQPIKPPLSGRLRS